MIIVALILAVIVGYLRGGTLKKITKFDFPYFPIAIVALLINLNINIVMRIIPFDLLGYLLLLATYLLLIAFVWLNRQNEFLLLVLIGLLLNFLVIALNGGMPIAYGAIKALGANSGSYLDKLANDFKHVPMFASAKLKYLGAIIPLPRPFPLPGVYSVGDIFLTIGLFLFTQNYITYSGKHRQKQSLDLGLQTPETE